MTRISRNIQTWCGICVWSLQKSPNLMTPLGLLTQRHPLSLQWFVAAFSNSFWPPTRKLDPPEGQRPTTSCSHCGRVQAGCRHPLSALNSPLASPESHQTCVGLPWQASAGAAVTSCECCGAKWLFKGTVAWDVVWLCPEVDREHDPVSWGSGVGTWRTHSILKGFAMAVMLQMLYIWYRAPSGPKIRRKQFLKFISVYRKIHFLWV